MSYPGYPPGPPGGGYPPSQQPTGYPPQQPGMPMAGGGAAPYPPGQPTQVGLGFNWFQLLKKSKALVCVCTHGNMYTNETT